MSSSVGGNTRPRAPYASSSENSPQYTAWRHTRSSPSVSRAAPAAGDHGIVVPASTSTTLPSAPGRGAGPVLNISTPCQ